LIGLRRAFSDLLVEWPIRSFDGLDRQLILFGFYPYSGSFADMKCWFLLILKEFELNRSIFLDSPYCLQ